MDTSNPAPLVNAELLKRYTGRRVRCVMKVLREEGSSSFVGLSSDGMQLSVKHPSAGLPRAQFVEVIGVADSDRSLRAEIVTGSLRPLILALELFVFTSFLLMRIRPISLCQAECLLLTSLQKNGS
jgi:replication factor A3